MYDADSEGIALRHGCFIALGSWHVYKQATIVLFRFAAGPFLISLYEILFPGLPFRDSKRLKELLWMFLLIMLSYPRFKVELDNACSRTRQPNRCRLLRNLRMLCEYYIPLVCSIRY